MDTTFSVVLKIIHESSVSSDVTEIVFTMGNSSLVVYLSIVNRRSKNNGAVNTFCRLMSNYT